MKTNNPVSAYAIHILNKKHGYGNRTNHRTIKTQLQRS